MFIMTRRESLLLAAALLGKHTLRGQQPEATFSSRVDVVSVLATVRDKQGRIVRDLSKRDFRVEEDGRPQTIRYFAAETDRPLTLGLVIDTSGSVLPVLAAELNASSIFFRQVLRADRYLAFVIHFDFEVELLRNLTSSRAELEAALAELASSPPVLAPQPSGAGRTDRIGSTLLYDAILLASDELMKKRQGRKALILLTDGIDQGSRIFLPAAIEAAQRADTLVYSILFAAPVFLPPILRPPARYPPVWRPAGRGRVPAAPRFHLGKRVLERISTETGGHYFEVTEMQTLEKIFATIEEDLRYQYSLGYTPDQIQPGYRKIHVRVNRGNSVVQARDGYYAQ